MERFHGEAVNVHVLIDSVTVSWHFLTFEYILFPTEINTAYWIYGSVFSTSESGNDLLGTV